MNKKIFIIKTAAELIHTNGYNMTSVSDIMQAAQIGKGQFYYYFESKQELGLTVIDYCFKKWQNRVIKENLATAAPPEEKIDKMLLCTIDIHQKNAGKCGCFFGNLAIELSGHNELFREKIYQMFAEWTKYLTIVIDELRQNTALPIPIQSDILAQSIVAMLEGGIMLMKNKQDITPLINAANMVRKMLGIKERTA
ncbi:TetR/AcrR family transcriptional regulator [Pectinatus frisingensis]|uniref:TetR/AcrR family transcriptional regulator n=1 Tax=Pectinatus frisingensis TaxID=865 RepID=UPI001E5DEB74|nr:TetR/AcrR family transcriptional regulator [Pectinatus frisingensis]